MQMRCDQTVKSWVLTEYTHVPTPWKTYLNTKYRILPPFTMGNNDLDCFFPFSFHQDDSLNRAGHESTHFRFLNLGISSWYTSELTAGLLYLLGLCLELLTYQV